MKTEKVVHCVLAKKDIKKYYKEKQKNLSDEINLFNLLNFLDDYYSDDDPLGYFDIFTPCPENLKSSNFFFSMNTSYDTNPDIPGFIIKTNDPFFDELVLIYVKKALYESSIKYEQLSNLLTLKYSMKVMDWKKALELVIKAEEQDIYSTDENMSAYYKMVLDLLHGSLPTYKSCCIFLGYECR